METVWNFVSSLLSS